MPGSRRFIYFDLGNVILNFDHELAATQIAAVAQLDVEQVRELVFRGDLQRRYETGELTSRQFYDEFCQLTGSRADYDALFYAASNMFELNAAMLPILAQLRAAGYRLGILSNTCAAHWEFITDGRYSIIPAEFDHCVVSYRAGSMKPSREIFQIAADLAHVAAEDIFFTDDLPANVEGARRAGFDAELFTGAAPLAASLLRRGFEFNY